MNVIGDLVTNAGEKWPNKISAYCGDNTITYGEVLSQSRKLSSFFIESGLQKGNRICFYLEKRFEKIISIFSIALSGGVFVPIRRQSHINQVKYIINDCNANILITTSQNMPSILKNIDSMQCLHTIIVIGKHNFANCPEGIKLISWDEIMDTESNLIKDTYVTANDLAAIIYTSGSTGRAKGVVLSHLNLIAGVEKVSSYLKITSDDCLLSILTFGFDYGLNQLLSVWYHGAQIVLLDYLFPNDIINIVNKFRITGLAAVSATWIQLLQKDWDGSAMNKLRYITNTGGSIPEHYVRELSKRLPDTDIFLMYGLTEAFRSTYLEPKLVDRYPTSIGKAIPGEEIFVLDENDKPVKPGEIGQLVHRGKLVSQGYWNDKELTQKRFRPNPFQPSEVIFKEMVVYSGDLVRIDKDGFLYFIGRNDEMIKSLGNRISVTEVEEVIYQIKGIVDVVVFGIPHEINGQSVYAVVSIENDCDLTIQQIMRYCRENMPTYMAPIKIENWEALPRNSNGKLDRALVKQNVYQQLELHDTH
ncbi:acyl-CoA ligase (AMP-forming), exosortase A system-associated [Clostridium sporogenes]|uniref:acyl-CoA ligase (AMP-forming), exosortase A system-associated n=1 Tax=Clostridium sporogenes TaxID=1509 RepID=UPI002237CEAD|nr:acyl-CoA ligase (AMP-forming), exosortase A system-associated [Clostridium sporogenes]MCW6109097.1 acyl-CoA ligase (AMP-forming), exosortase A system-associated [Clostridium sporogenes]